MEIVSIFIFLLIYMLPVVIVLTIVSMIIQALRRIATAQEASARALEQIVGHLARQV